MLARNPTSAVSKRVEHLPLKDGVVLAADVYRPAGEGDWPVLLMRQPYGKAIASTVVLAHPSWYARHGYLVVVQDVRGMGASEGDFDCLRQELSDGAETVDWARGLEGANGKIGLYGFSYQAITQYLALAGGARVDAMAPAMGSFAPEKDWAYEGGAPRYAGMVGWAKQMALLKAAHDGDRETHAALSVLGGLDETARYLMDRPDLSHLKRWMDNDAADWDQVSPARLLREVSLDIPVLHTGGWYDFMLEGTLAADRAFRNASSETTHLAIGPWTHIPWNGASGSVRMPEAEAFSVDRANVAFFDFYLKGKGDSPPALTVFDLGERAWRTFRRLPATTEKTMALCSGGLAATLANDGRLGDEPGDGEDVLVSDPFRPAPLVGGHVGEPSGFVDRAPADDRSDVAVYTTAPFAQPFTVCGPVRADITISTEAPVFDLVATLSLVSPTGGANVIQTGIARTKNTGAPVSVGLRAAYVTAPAGFSLRLSLQAAAWPAFSLHAQDPASADGMNAQPLTLAIRHAASRLVLSVLNEDTANGA
ncbi:CocE/NonD family hydrolase [Martelella lutilitoris]|uniref:CocE/NonD family hydrolase n=1 Tax=Martelella lutilitoris TaxID=2583532 RepID=A0A7T7HLW2_9HYPH|nr:CocE/NonD family hydrolase [Martelella lutilitoris]QQM31613.1 CocE/NonD family hydrolase [Martelella lutilitoris]